MRYRADSVSTALLATCKQDALYQLLFVGGPLDGCVARSETLPKLCLDLPSGSAEYGSVVAFDVLRRFARYRWTSSRLTSGQAAPVVLLRYEHS